MFPATKAWRLSIVCLPEGYRPRSAEDLAPAAAEPYGALQSYSSRGKAEAARRQYNRRALTTGSQKWAVVTVDDEMLDAGDAIDAACRSMPEGFYVSGYACREVIGDNRVMGSLSLTVDEFQYVDGMDAGRVLAILRAELERLEAALRASRRLARKARRSLALA